jgi:hypothetical protein
MPQDRETGAAGDQFGRSTAPIIAARIGAKMQGDGSNAASYEGLRAVIKCARVDTGSVGVTYSMLADLDVIIGAFEQENGQFKVYSLKAEFYRARMEPTRSMGRSKGKVGKVSKQMFEEHGELIATVAIADVA